MPRNWVSSLVALACLGCTVEKRNCLPSTWTPFEPVVPAVAPLAETELGNEPDIGPARPQADTPAEPPPPLVHTIEPAAEPCTLTLEVGQELVFVNQDEICHSLFSSSAPNDFATGLLPPRGRASVHFANPGAVLVYCSLHDHRQLTIQVVPPRTAR